MPAPEDPLDLVSDLKLSKRRCVCGQRWCEHHVERLNAVINSVDALIVAAIRLLIAALSAVALGLSSRKFRREFCQGVCVQLFDHLFIVR